MKTAAFITARLKSQRLPGKALLPLCGRPLVGHLIDRLRKISFEPQIVLCTSTLPQDDALAKFASSEGIDCFRGHPQDVLVRLRDAADHFVIDEVLSVTADNPLTDTRGLEDLWQFHVDGEYDFTRCDGLPWGAFGYAVSRHALNRACRLKGTEESEVWGGYFTQTRRFRCGNLRIDDFRRRWPELRVTVDTIEDFQFVSEVFTALYRPGRVFGIEEVIAFFHAHPDLLELNAKVSQKTAAPIRLLEEVR